MAIQGGGIRGIIPVKVIAALEALTGRLARDVFSFLGGTSTGALAVAAMAAGVPAAEILKVYTERSKDIFTPRGVPSEARLLAEGYRYDPKKLAAVMAGTLGACASWRVNDFPVGLCVSATAMDGHNWYFVKDGERNARTTGRVRLIDAAVASACAPTYHDHWTIVMPGGEHKSFFDGGVGGVANPAYETCVEMFEHGDYSPAETRLVTLGTGFYPASDSPPGGLVATIGWAVSTLVDSASDWVDAAVARQWPGVATKHNWPLPRAIGEDDLKSIPSLADVGDEAAVAMDWKSVLSVAG